MFSDICDEHLMQYAKPGQNGECELILGLDFGTSASKVVIQAPDLPGRPAYAINFEKYAHSSMPFLLPTTLWVQPNGACTLDRRDGARLINDIKLELFSKDEGLRSNRGPSREKLPPEPVAVAYLALLLQYARQWLLITKRDVVGHFGRLNWSMNLGVPSPCIEENEENYRFRRVGKAAWMLSAMEERITIQKAEAELGYIIEAPEYWERDDDGLTCDFEIIPEIAAGAVGYAQSDQRREGLHIMVDVGASTVDACIFLLHQDEGDLYSLLTTDVEQLGTIRLHFQRVAAIQNAFQKQAENFRDKHDPLAPLTESIEPYLISRERLEAEVHEYEQRLKQECEVMLRRLIWDAKAKRAPFEKVWNGGRLPILPIGGGINNRFFRSIVEDLGPWLSEHSKSEGANVLTLQVPETLHGSYVDYQRLAVAWGLSHRSFDIGDIIAPHDLPDIAPPGCKDWKDQFIGKDQV